MIKGSKIKLDMGPPRLSEDIYLCTEFGLIVNRREHKRREMVNIFEIFSSAEQEFILRNMKFSKRPLLFAISKLGPVFIDITAVRTYGFMSVILPSVPPEESLSLAFGRLRGDVSPSEKANKLAAVFGIDDALEISTFESRMLSVYSGLCGFDFDAHTNLEASRYLSDKVSDYGALFGCDLKLSVKSSDFADSPCGIAALSFYFVLTSFALIAREYSSERNARIDIFFDGGGAYFDLGFKIVSSRRADRLTRISPELALLKVTAENKKLITMCYQNEDSFVLRIFPWSRYPTGNETKKPEPEFDY